MSGNLKKLAIHAYKDDKFNEEASGSPLHVQLNPENFALNSHVLYDEEQEPGTSGNDLNFDKIEPRSLSFDFLFDQTGALDGSEPTDNGVEDQIDKFRKVTLDYEGEIHQPKFLKLAWGVLIFYCRIESMEISYKMFRPDGMPLRAVVSVTFKEYIEKTKRAAEENAQSPDLTQVRMVSEGDQLPLMSHKIYGSIRYYSEVARFNGLRSLRSLKPGEKMVFPPLENN